MDTNLQKYRAFIGAVECGSFTRAAQRLHYSQSGISRMIGDLEREWGMALLQRGHAGVQLTAQGLELASRCWRQYSDLCQVLESRLDLPAEQLSSQAIAVVADLGPDGVQGILDSVGRPA